MGQALEHAPAEAKFLARVVLSQFSVCSRSARAPFLRCETLLDHGYPHEFDPDMLSELELLVVIVNYCAREFAVRS